MSDPLIVECDATHLYPGAIGRVYGDPPGMGDAAACAVHFSDLSVCPATLTAGPEDGARLDAEAYVTGAGTSIPAKRWLISLAPDRDFARFRVTRRA